MVEQRHIDKARALLSSDADHREVVERVAFALDAAHRKGRRETVRDAARLATHKIKAAVFDIGNQLAERNARVLELEGMLATPHISDFLEAVKLEALHQRERWGVEHDAGKEPHDWFWLIGYLAGKALASAMRGDREKALHHTISTAATLLNWHAALTGSSNAMRPGIEPPATEVDRG